MRKNNISFILHKPQLSENIGACARGMKNFDFQKLIVIKPKPILEKTPTLLDSPKFENSKTVLEYDPDGESIWKEIKNQNRNFGILYY